MMLFGSWPPMKMQRHTDGITLACLVLSKILGIGSAERNWKQVKATNSAQRVNTGIDKTKKQVLIHTQ
jgi:hypothetical protein